MRVRAFTWMAALTAASATVSWAQEGELFDKLDANKDGFVAEDEVTAEQKPIFERLLRQGDKDGDKKLSKEELAGALKAREGDRQPATGQGGGRPLPPPREILNRLDRDGDGKLSRDEAPERMKENFDRIDTNSDASIDLAELERAFAAMRGAPGRRPGGAPEAGRPGSPPGAGGMALVRVLDANGDGELSADEIANASKALAKLDKDSDGKVSREELFPRAPDRPGEGPGAELFRRLREADADQDGKLSREEAPPRIKENFDRLDTNSDGQLDRAEIREMVERMRNSGQRRPENRRPEDRRPEGGRPGKASK